MKAEAKKVLRKVVEFGPNENGDFVLLSQFFDQCGFHGSKKKALKKFIDQAGYTNGRTLNSTGIELGNQINLKSLLVKLVMLIKSGFEAVKVLIC